MPESSEAKIVVIGNKGVGKTTVLNALRQSPSCGRTCSIEDFVFKTHTDRPVKRHCRRTDEESAVLGSGKGTENDKESSTNRHEQVISENKKVIEKTLVLIDTPGIGNHSNDKSLSFIQKAWLEFDCVIVVVEVSYLPKKDNVISLLSFVKQQKDVISDIPVMILCNKVDDPKNRKSKHLVKSLQAEVERIFGVCDREQALEDIVEGSLLPRARNANPCFIPVSARKAVRFSEIRCPRVSSDDQTADAISNGILLETYFDPNELADDEKQKLIFRIANNPCDFKRRVDQSNFGKVLYVLDRLVGLEGTKHESTGEELDATLSLFLSGKGIVDNLNIVYNKNEQTDAINSHIKSIFWISYSELKEKTIGWLTADVTEVSSLHKPMYELVQYSKTLHQKLHAGASASDSGEDQSRIVLEMKDLIRRQFQVVITHATKWVPIDPDLTSSSESPGGWVWREGSTVGGWYNIQKGKTYPTARHEHPANYWPAFWNWDESEKMWTNKYSMDRRLISQDINPATVIYNWSSLSPYDWHNILSSIFMVSGDRIFYEHFGKEIAEMNYIRLTGRFLQPEYCYNCKVCSCDCEKIGAKFMKCLCGSYVDGSFVPLDESKYGLAKHIQIPDKLSDPDHWGHLGWMFVEFMTSLSLKSE